MKKRIVSAIMAALIVSSLVSCGNTVNINVPENLISASDTQSARKTQILGQDSEPGEKYTLDIGLNDKDTGEQKVDTEAALEKANLICAKYAGGYTQFSAKGGWTNDDGSLGHENTMVYLIYDISEDNLKALLDELLKEFNQSAILVEKESTAHINYTGQ